MLDITMTSQTETSSNNNHLYHMKNVLLFALLFSSYKNLTYYLPPRSQNIVPNIRAVTVVERNLTAVYGGFRQYDQCCFHKQAIH